jgi:hypothetical protein
VTRARRLALAVAVLAGAALTVGRLVPVGSDVVVRDEGGREVVRTRLPESGRFALEYVHSVYRAEVSEIFAAEAGGGFRLVAIASASEAALDYYALEGRREVRDGRRRLEPAGSPRLERLPLVATGVGRRTLVVGGRRLPLYAAGRAPARLELTVGRASWLGR